MKNKEKIKILNIGCGLSKYGTHFIDLYPQRREVKRCDVENDQFPYKNDVFDKVYTENLFEHLCNPNDFLLKVYQVLKNDGKLVLITDNASFWGWHFPRARTHYGGYEKINTYGIQDRHFGLYTSWHLMNHLEKVGFKNIKVEYLMTKEKNPLTIRIISLLLKPFSKRMSYAQIIVTGIK